MDEVILLKDGELALKGLNRRTFEDVLLKSVKRRLKNAGEFSFFRAQSTTVIEPLSSDCDMDLASDMISRVFGISAFSRAAKCEKDIDSIKKTAGSYLKNELLKARTFKVEAKRSDKKFPLKSPEICEEVGGYLLSFFGNLKVDVHNPQVTVYIEIRDKRAFVHGSQQKGAGGLPEGVSGKAIVLISGGIDSPVAAWMMAKRGLKLSAVHFASPPFTSKRAEMKVRDLLKKVALYSGDIEFYTVPFTEIQEKIRDFSIPEMATVTTRRMMMKIASEIAAKNGSGALITGESLGQVASQTIYAINCTDEASKLPVLRPLIGMDKNEIIEISRKIGAFDISIEPYEDCCTVFTPKHPKIKPTLDLALKAEQMAYDEILFQNAVKNATFEIIKGNY